MKRRTRLTISAVLAFVGFISYFLAVSTSDYYDEIHEYYSWDNMIPLIIFGTVCLLLSVIIDRPSRLFRWIAPIQPLFYLFLYDKCWVRSKNARVCKRLRNMYSDLNLWQYYVELTYLYAENDTKYGGLFR